MRALSALIIAVSSGACALTPDPDNGGLTLPDGFRAVVVARDLGPARQVAVRSNGDVFVCLRRSAGGGGIVALRDEDGDGRADRVERFSERAGSGIGIHDGWLYLGEDEAIHRVRLTDSLTPPGPWQTVVSGFPRQQAHAVKTFAFDGEGSVYVNVGAPSNACMERLRTPGSPGRRPCPELDVSGGVWRFDASRENQRHGRDGERFATGLRNCVAIAWNGGADALYVVMHGRDQLDSLWPDLYTAQQNAELPAEEFHLLREGADAGWPYTYWDPERDARIVAPEYGGGPSVESDDPAYQDPIDAFPAHWAPNDLVFYDGAQFPERYRGGAFVAFHGSWNRAPMPQRGYFVTFTPFEGERPSGPHEVFANGFAGREEIQSPRQARHRPCGLAVGPDGSLFIVDSVRGTLWRVFHTGE